MPSGDHNLFLKNLDNKKNVSLNIYLYFPEIISLYYRCSDKGTLLKERVSGINDENLSFPGNLGGNSSTNEEKDRKNKSLTRH